ncbi:MAG: DNA ligase-associated DEXH box helicase, partial [Burkholderiales bacterium]|nr:DNA ligase-associated DEXH box helicase [Burkholderiales bacterium]
MVEAVAARRAAQAGQVESRRTPVQPLDVLVQHLVTVALGGDIAADTPSRGDIAADTPSRGDIAADTTTGGDIAARARPCTGFVADELYAEVRGTTAYRSLARAEFDWALAFVERGGDSLGAYPEYHRVQPVDGRWRVVDRGIARRHRLQVGTIVADATMAVKWLGGGTLGSVEEGFIARLKPGDCFVFAGRRLEYVRTRDLAAYVRLAPQRRGLVPAWAGGRMPLSSELAAAVQAVLDEAAGVIEAGADFAAGEPELQAASPMLRTQARLSQLPRSGRLLLERWRSREGEHWFLYPHAGRSVHIGLAQLLAWRLAREQPNTFSLSVNDYGLEILAASPLAAQALQALRDGRLFAADGLLPDVLASLNSGALAQRRFREIARVAGLVFGGYPGAPKSLRQLQASSSLFFEVFRTYDAGNRLLAQAEAEVLAQELDIGQLARTLQSMAARPLQPVELRSPSPFALPLMVERLREQLSTEGLKQRLDRLLA